MPTDGDGRVLRGMLRETVRHAHGKSSVRGMVPGSVLPAPSGAFVTCCRCEITGARKPFSFHCRSAYYAGAILMDHMLVEHALECAFCFLKFDGFKELAEHTQLAHVPENERKHEYTEAGRTESRLAPGREVTQTGRGQL